MKWKKRGDAVSIETAIEQLAGTPAYELIHPVDTDPDKIQNLQRAAELILKAIDNMTPITIFGDYDADGVCAGAILALLIDKYGRVKPHLRMPRRLSEGYGSSQAAVDEIDAGLLITVDNGIKAIEAIRAAKAKGLTVIILDHHQPGESLPEADVTVDLHVPAYNTTGVFQDFCGAGLAYKLAQLMRPDDNDLLEKCCALAAIATVADIMPLTDANRVIVKRGLEALCERRITKGLQSLLDACDLTKVNEENIGFLLAPTINAMGRLFDNGAKKACACVAADKKSVPALAQELVSVNLIRKSMVNEAINKILQDIIGTDPALPIVVHVEWLHPGLAGIVAGKLSETYKVPVFVFAGKTTDEKLVCSGRSGGDVNILGLVEEARHLTLNFGGHAGAVGVSIAPEDFKNFQICICESYKYRYITMGWPKNDDLENPVLYYDLELHTEEIPEAILRQERFAPFGEKVPKPVVKITGVHLTGANGPCARFMGPNRESIRLTTKGFQMVGFGLAEAYKAIGMPTYVDVIGTLSFKDDKYGKAFQVTLLDIQKATEETNPPLPV